MKILFFILTFTIFFPKYSLAIDCSDIDVNPQITVRYSFGKLSYDYSKNVAEITKMANDFNLVENNNFAEGLSTSNINFDISIKTSAHPIGIKRFCVVPSQVDILLGLNNPVIYISNSLKKDSCKYNLVLRHEKTHQQINKTVLEYYLPIFKAAVTKIIQKNSASEINDTNLLESKTRELSQKYSSQIKPLVDFIKKETSNEHLKLDNPANYTFEGQLCP